MAKTVLNVDDAIRKAIDNGDARLAGVVADALRARGFTYDQVLARVQKVRPDVTEADWDELQQEADALDAHAAPVEVE